MPDKILLRMNDMRHFRQRVLYIEFDPNNAEPKQMAYGPAFVDPKRECLSTSHEWRIHLGR